MDKGHHTMREVEFTERKPPQQESKKYILIHGEYDNGERADHQVPENEIINITVMDTGRFRCIVRLRNGSIIRSHTSADDIIRQSKRNT